MHETAPLKHFNNYTVSSYDCDQATESFLDLFQQQIKLNTKH